jgi:hypothetical protein
VLWKFLTFNWFAMLWPLFIILPGLPFLYAAYNTDDEDQAGMIIPGIILTGTGLIFMFQGLTGHYESWAYAWALFPAMVGLGLQFMGKKKGVDTEEEKVGRAMTRGGLAAFAAFGLFFELLLFGGIFGGTSGALLPFTLLGAGAYWYAKRSGHEFSIDDEMEKRKNNLSVDEKPKNKVKNTETTNEHNPAAINPELKRKIEEALKE